MKDTYLINNIPHTLNTFYSTNFSSGSKIRTQNQLHLSIKIKKLMFSLTEPKIFWVSEEIHTFDLWGEVIISLCRYSKTLYLWVSLGYLMKSLNKTKVNIYVFYELMKILLNKDNNVYQTPLNAYILWFSSLKNLCCVRPHVTYDKEIAINDMERTIVCISPTSLIGTYIHYFLRTGYLNYFL